MSEFIRDQELLLSTHIISVPEVKLMGVELIGVNKLGLINWSQLIGVN